MPNVLLVGIGGFLGAVARYALGGWVQRAAPGPLFPYGTLAVNLLGCFLIGVLAGLVETRGVLSPESRVFLLIGVLGGFTTFSTFGYETLQLFRDGQSLYGFLNIGASVLLGLGAVWLGFVLPRAIG